MVCKSCGAGLSDDTILCPYCGWENETLAAKERETEITEIMEKTHEYMHRPEGAAKKTSAVMLWIMIGVLVLTMLSILPISCINQMEANKEDEVREEALIELEKLYVAGDYAAMYEYLRDVPEYYSATYRKYNEIGNLYMGISGLEEHCPRTVEFVLRNPDKSEFLTSDLQDLFGLIGKCRALEDAGYIFGEEEPVSDYSARAKSILEEVFLLTDDEVQSGIEISKSEAPDYTELRDVSLERLNGGNE